MASYQPPPTVRHPEFLRAQEGQFYDRPFCHRRLIRAPSRTDNSRSLIRTWCVEILRISVEDATDLAYAKTSLLQTKFHPPVMPVDFVVRPQLRRRLDERRPRPLTLVSAPAGYGKSTLVSSWLAASDCPAVWISLDKGDNDRIPFLAYLLAGLPRNASDIGRGFKNWLRVAELRECGG